VDKVVGVVTGSVEPIQQIALSFVDLGHGRTGHLLLNGTNDLIISDRFSQQHIYDTGIDVKRQTARQVEFYRQL